MRWIWYDRTLCRPRPQQRRGALECRRRPGSRPLLRLGTRFGDEFRGVLCRGFECIDELSLAFLLILALLCLFAPELESTLFAYRSVVLFLFFESLGGLFLTLDVEFDQGSVLGTVCLYPGFRLGNVDVVYQVKGYM